MNNAGGRWLALAAGTVLTLMVLTGCGGGSGLTGGAANGLSTPESTVRSAYAALLNNDMNGVERALSPNMDNAMRKGLLSAFTAWQSASDSDKDAIRISNVTVRQTGDNATADVTFKKGKADVITLVRRSGQWLIVGVE